MRNKIGKLSIIYKRGNNASSKNMNWFSGGRTSSILASGEDVIELIRKFLSLRDVSGCELSFLT